MILIEIKDDSIKVSGHANYATKWNDVVCAAISAITQSSITWFSKNEIKVKLNKKIPIIELTLIDNKKENKDKLNLLIKQLQFVQKSYKKYIKIVRK